MFLILAHTVPIDEGHAIHYTAVPRGAPVYGSDEVEVGKVDEVVDNYREHILDGIIIRTPGRDLRFVDGPEVQRTFERAVILNITSEQAADLPKPERGPGTFRPSRARGRLGRLFGGGWKRQ
jgi:PRC-barrel domain